MKRPMKALIACSTFALLIGSAEGMDATQNQDTVNTALDRTDNLERMDINAREMHHTVQARNRSQWIILQIRSRKNPRDASPNDSWLTSMPRSTERAQQIKQMINEPNNQVGGLTPFQFAIDDYRSKDAELLSILEYFIEIGANTNIRSENGDTPIHQAARKADSDILIQLINILLAHNFGRQVNNQQGNSDFLEAWKIEKLRKLLLIKNHDGETPIHISAKTSNSANLQYLIQKMKEIGLPIDLKNDQGYSLAEIAMDSLQFSNVRMLMDNGSTYNPNMPDIQGNIPIFKEISTLMRMLQENQNLNEEVERILNSSSTTLDEKIQQLRNIVEFLDGKPSLKQIIKKGNSDIIEIKKIFQKMNILLQLGAKLDIRNQNGDTPLLVVASAPKSFTHPAVFTLPFIWLMNQNVNINVRNEKGKTPIICAVEKQNKPLAALMFALGGDPILTDNGRNNALLYLPHFDNGFLFDQIFAKKENISPFDISLALPNGESMISRCAISDNISLIKVLEPQLLNIQSLINLAQTETGNTPAHWAAMLNNIEMMKWLKTHGANFNIKNKGGKTPKEVAIAQNHLYMQRLIDAPIDPDNPNIPDIQYIPPQNAQRNILVSDPNSFAKDGVSKIHSLSRPAQSSLELHKLLKMEINANIPDNYGDTPLLYAIDGIAGSLPQIPAENVEKALSQAAYKVQLLFEYNANPLLENKDHRSALNAAGELVRTLIRQNAQPNVIGIAKQIRNMIAQASLKNNQNILGIYSANLIQLIQQNLGEETIDQRIQAINEIVSQLPNSINIPGSDGKTPLYIAIETQKPEICSFLLSQDADLGQKLTIDAKQTTPAKLAKDLNKSGQIPDDQLDNYGLQKSKYLGAIEKKQ